MSTMHSIVIVSRNKEQRDARALKICQENHIDKFDIGIIESTSSSSTVKSIGIEEIRSFQKKVFLKPFKSKIKAIILKINQNFTIEAQNALLKVLEEPPLNTIIILTVSNHDILLPTILSRCRIIELNQKIEISEEESAQYFNLLISLLSLGIGGRLKLAQDIGKNKEEATFWLEKMILAIRKKIIQDQVSQCSRLLISFQDTHKVLSTTNANQRLAIENLFLNLNPMG